MAMLENSEGIEDEFTPIPSPGPPEVMPALLPSHGPPAPFSVSQLIAHSSQQWPVCQVSLVLTESANPVDPTSGSAAV